MLSAKHYSEREDACRAGRMAGDAYALVILIVLAFLSWTDMIAAGWHTLWFAAAVAVGMRVGMEWLMGRSWDHYQHRRLAMHYEGATTSEAFDRTQ